MSKQETQKASTKIEEKSADKREPNGKMSHNYLDMEIEMVAPTRKNFLTWRSF